MSRNVEFTSELVIFNLELLKLSFFTMSLKNFNEKEIFEKNKLISPLGNVHEKNQREFI